MLFANETVNITDTFQGNWNKTYVVLSNGKFDNITHTPEQTCIATFICSKVENHLDGANLNGIFYQNLHLKTNSTPEEFEAAIKASNLKLVKIV